MYLAKQALPIEFLKVIAVWNFLIDLLLFQSYTSSINIFFITFFSFFFHFHCKKDDHDRKHWWSPLNKPSSENLQTCSTAILHASLVSAVERHCQTFCVPATTGPTNRLIKQQPINSQLHTIDLCSTGQLQSTHLRSQTNSCKGQSNARPSMRSSSRCLITQQAIFAINLSRKLSHWIWTEDQSAKARQTRITENVKD